MNSSNRNGKILILLLKHNAVKKRKCCQEAFATCNARDQETKSRNMQNEEFSYNRLIIKTRFNRKT